MVGDADGVDAVVDVTVDVRLRPEIPAKEPYDLAFTFTVQVSRDSNQGLSTIYTVWPKMAPVNAASDDSHQRLLDKMDIASVHKSFRSPSWKPAVRRNKNVKQIMTEASRKEASLLATQNNSGATTPLAGSAASPAPGMSNISEAAKNLSTLVLERNTRQAFSSGPAATYSNIESAPSLHPAHQKHYCDITGLPAPYTDPKSRLRYHNQEVFGVVRSLGQGVAESYLEARGAHVVLK